MTPGERTRADRQSATLRLELLEPHGVITPTEAERIRARIDKKYG